MSSPVEVVSSKHIIQLLKGVTELGLCSKNYKKGQKKWSSWDFSSLCFLELQGKENRPFLSGLKRNKYLGSQDSGNPL